ncbi:MAG: formate--tetrahydrofolate ligase [Thermoplasmata archaeon]|nr:formate--tetrahydrofolate ligase [Thermoplasmata archaeon]
MLEISEVAKKLGIKEKELIPYGRYKAKVSLDVLKRARKKAKSILVTTINPTPEGEGKTTMAIGIAQALSQLGKKAVVSIREPSIGPIMGIKGGGTGGGRSKVVPSDDINLHFNGDMHAVAIAHNLLSALVDNHIYHGNSFHIDPRYVVWPRVIDMNDRNLRNVVVGLGGPKDGVPRQDRFSITAASEVMAILCLSNDIDDLKKRLSKVIAAYSYNEEPITAKHLKAVGAMTALLKDAIKPNIVQTLETTPAFVHGGPFANIAHGTSSIVAAKMAIGLADYFVTEAGFGTDLGAEKFFNIVSRLGISIDAVVIVVSLKALKWHGGMSLREAKRKRSIRAIRKGIKNLEKHIENIEIFGIPFIIALNKFEGDDEKEIMEVEKYCNDRNIPFAVAEPYSMGGEGCIELAGKLVSLLHEKKAKFEYLYSLDMSVKEKIEAIAKKIYGAARIVYSVTAEDDIRIIKKLGLENIPICMAKTPYSLADDPALRGRPEGFKITIKEIRISAGAGFLVPITGKITTMPGLPLKPNAEKINVDGDGNIIGVS